MKRHNLRLNLDQEFSRIFKAGIKFSYSNVNANSTSVGTGGNGDNMIMRLIDYADCTLLEMLKGLSEEERAELMKEVSK